MTKFKCRSARDRPEGRGREHLPAVPIYVGRLGPALGVHGGPGIIGTIVVEAEKA